MKHKYNKSILVSVIIPIFNSEKYLEKCIESVIRQSYKNLEIILVDDGSNDRSNIICKKMCRLDNRIRLILKKNEGQAIARNTAIKVAKGDYISFVDSDDIIKEYYIEKLLRAILESNAQISCCLYQRFIRKISNQKRLKMESDVYEVEDAIEDLCYQRFFNNAPWGKLFEKSLFDLIEFPDCVVYEDMAIIYKVFARANKICLVNDRMYFYRQVPDSMIRKKFSDKKLVYIDIAKEMYNFISENYPMLEKAAEARYFYSNLQMLRDIPNNKKYINEKEIIISNICKHRRNIIENPKVKIYIRVLATFSYFGISTIRILMNVACKIVTQISFMNFMR